MSSSFASPLPEASPTRPLGSALVGRMFVGPWFDYVLIGGGLSLLMSVAIFKFELLRIGNFTFKGGEYAIYWAFPLVLLLCNSSHFAASTVRLYTKPGAYSSLPFLTMTFPLVCMAILTVCIWRPMTWGWHLQALYLTWSPYHFAAQAYGLTVVYCYRSGCQLEPSDKRLLWWVAMVPFFFAFLTGSNNGLGWIFPDFAVHADGTVHPLVAYLGLALKFAAIAGPAYLYARMWNSPSGPMPLIGPLLLAANSIWWFILPAMDAFMWATVFHGLQYLAIVIIFHVKDQMACEDNRWPAWAHVVSFYGACLALAYALFLLVPMAYESIGYGRIESMLLVAAAINVHHFIVDGYIWRLGRKDSNRRVVDDAIPPIRTKVQPTA